MLKGIGSFIVGAVLLLAMGYMTGYICGSVKAPTYRTIGRAIDAFWLASGALFIAGVVFRIAFKRLSSVCGVLFCVSLVVALVLSGFYHATWSNGSWL